jgi:hypothetical protein
MIARLLREGLLRLVVGLAVTGTITTFAVVNKLWGWPNAVVGGLLLLCGTLYLMDRFGIGPPLKSRVRDWLDRSGYSIRTIDDDNAFHFVMTDNIGCVTDIFQVKADSPVSIVSGKHKATPEQLKAFKAMSPQQQWAFWRSVRLELLRYGVGFSDLTLEGEGVNFSDQFVVGRAISGPEFLRRLLFVRSGARLYQEILLGLSGCVEQSPAN